MKKGDVVYLKSGSTAMVIIDEGGSSYNPLWKCSWIHPHSLIVMEGCFPADALTTEEVILSSN